MGTAYAYVKGQWIRCISQYYKSFQNRSEREVKLATVELRRTRQKSSKRINLTAKERAAYLEEAEAKEAIMEKVFRYRQLRCFLVDEAQHLLMMSGGHQMLHQMNWIKSIANLTGTVHILFGTYELLNCSTLNGQVGRRSEDIHLTPYQLDEAEDVTEFIRVIRTLQKHLPLEEEPYLENYYEYLFSGSVGCVGILKNWLTRSLRFAYEEDAATLTIKHLEQGAFSQGRINQIFQESEQGQLRLKQESNYYFIGNLTTSVTPDVVQGASLKKGRVGKRKPKRDPVGTQDNES
ncbi:ATP-binding protein [Merismopedia glauca CCAP 1448/3]|uniref:ATP-binding protein n=2 Tax=Merismopedia TaxID=53402 RepID=A0A2T1C6Q0_9CYAN|nr:ATP-binding protein [Merismopedia glauca CCAP 1448/3]